MTSRFLRVNVLLSLAILIGAAVVPLPAAAATGDILAVRVLENGWQAEIDIEGAAPGGTYAFGLGPNNDPANAKVRLLVTSEGYDASGNAVTRTRTVYGTTFVRQVYPNQLLKDERVTGNVLTVKVALSDFVYADDRAGGAGTSGTDIVAAIAGGFYTNTAGAGEVSAVAVMDATNSSTLDYPKVIGRFAWPGYEKVGSSIPVEAVALQRFAEDGKPVAAVTFTARDQHSNSVWQTVSDMTISTRGVDAHPVQVYRADLSTAGLTQGDTLTVNFRAYPWIGDEDSVLDSSTSEDGVAQPHADLGPLSFVNDKDGTYGTGYALVSSAAPATGGVVYSSKAAAEAAGPATGFQTIGAAAQAIKAYQGTNFGRTSAGGGVVLLTEGTHSAPGISLTDLGAMDTWLTVTRAAGARKEFTIIGSAVNKTFTAQKLKLDGLTLSASGVAVLKGRAASDLLWIHDSTVIVPTAGGITTYKLAYLTQNQLTNLYSKMFVTIPNPLVRGNDAAVYTKGSFYALLGNNGVIPTFHETGAAGNPPVSDNSIVAYNTIYGLTIALGSFANKTEIDHGVAIVGNVLEKVTETNPLLQVAADSSASNVNNVLIWRNTVVGERSNLGYNDNGSTGWTRLNWSVKFNTFEQWNNKDDVFHGHDGPNPGRIGAWTVGHNVGSVGNVMESAAFRGEFDGLHTTVNNRDLRYTRDGSYEGNRAGNGDYRLLAGSVAIDRAPGMSSVLPFDLLGNPVSGASTDAGAYEFYAGLPPADTTSPIVTVVGPQGTLPSGTTSTMLEVTTNEQASCSYAGPALLTSDGRTHTLALTGLVDGQSYAGTVTCEDVAGNDGTASVSFAVATAPVDTTAPTVSITGPGSLLPAGTSNTTLAASTNEVAQCAYDASSGTPFASMTLFSTTNATAHTVEISSLSDGEDYQYYVRCKDAADNVSNPVSVSFEVSSAVTGTTPVLRYSFDGSTLTDTTVSDLSGNGYTGTLVGSPVRVAGVMGDALEFNGSNYVDLGSSSFGLADTFTIAFRIKRNADNAAASYDSVIARGQYVNPFAVTLLSSGAIRLGTRTPNSAYMQTTARVTNGTWAHVAIVYANGTRSIYLDGTLVKTDTVTGTVPWSGTTNRTYLGKSMLAGAEGVNAVIDDLRIYNTALTPSEVAGVYNTP